MKYNRKKIQEQYFFYQVLGQNFWIGESISSFSVLNA